MTTASAPALIHIALQDLLTGKRDQQDRLDTIAANLSDATLREVLAREVGRVAEQADRIERAGVTAGAQPNLWMRGILDDAERDSRQIQPGRLLDIALIGAIRKAKAAEIVSSETAIALAAEIGTADLHAIVTQNRTEEIESDHRLRRRLAALTGQP